MNHNQETSIRPINASSSRFGVEYENQFFVMDDAKHVIGVDPRDARNLILENIENGKADKFGWEKNFSYLIGTLVYDKDMGSLYMGFDYDRLYKYKLDKKNKTCKRVKDFGDLGIGCISSSHRFMHFVFFGGDQGKIRILDLSTGELLPVHLETSIGWICSLQVCVKSKDEIYLAVSGCDNDYSNDKTDLFDLTDLLSTDSVIV